MKNKKKTLENHTKKRIFERFGKSFNHQMIKDMANICKNQKYLLHLGHQSLMKSKMIIKFQNEIFPVIYDKSRHCIITVLTLDMLSDEEKNLLNETINCTESK